MARAITSLPEPVSPNISTGTSEAATCSTRSITGRKPVSAPTIDSVMSCRSSRDKSACFVGLERFAERLHFPEPRVVFQSGGERLEAVAAPDRHAVCENGRPACPTISISPSGVFRFAGERPDEQRQRVREATRHAGGSRRTTRAASLRDADCRGTFDAPGHVPALAPLEQCRQLGLMQRGLRGRHAGARAGHAGSHRLQARPLPIDAANDEASSGICSANRRQQPFDRFVNLQVPTDFPPDVEDQLHIRFPSRLVLWHRSAGDPAHPADEPFQEI